MSIVEKIFAEPWYWIWRHKFLSLSIAVVSFLIGAAVISGILNFIGGKMAEALAGKLWILPLLFFWFPPIALFLGVAVLAVKYNIRSIGTNA